MKTDLFIKLLQEIEATNVGVKYASATFQILESADFNTNVRK